MRKLNLLLAAGAVLAFGGAVRADCTDPDYVSAGHSINAEARTRAGEIGRTSANAEICISQGVDLFFSGVVAYRALEAAHGCDNDPVPPNYRSKIAEACAIAMAKRHSAPRVAEARSISSPHSNPSGSSSGSCSTITGIQDIPDPPKGSCANQGKGYADLGRRSKGTNPPLAASAYRKAAEAYRAAGLPVQAAEALRKLAAIMGPPAGAPYKNATNSDLPSPSGHSTAYCSSTEVGQAKQCISITKSGDGGRRGYYVNATCDGTYYAAISTYDENDKCERSVVSASSGNPTLVYSYFHRPGVLDAIAGGKLSRLYCYTARHRGRAC